MASYWHAAVMTLFCVAGAVAFFTGNERGAAIMSLCFLTGITLSWWFIAWLEKEYS